MWRRVLVQLLVCAAGCAPAPSAPVSHGVAPARAAPSGSANAPAHAGSPTTPRLGIVVAPVVTPEPAVRVDIVAEGDPTALTSWSMSSPAGEVRDLVAEDAGGAIPVRRTKRDAAIVVSLERRPAASVHLHYAVPAPIAAVQGVASGLLRPAVEVTPDRMVAFGEALLLLPDGAEDRAFQIDLRFDYGALGAGRSSSGIVTSAASSFGFGERLGLGARTGELRGACFVAGALGRALFDAPEGHDEAAWLGYTTFDPRPVAADLAAFRTAVRERLGDGSAAAPQTLLLVTDTRPDGAFVAARRTASIVVHVGVGQGWTAPLRIAVATEVVHEWIGSKLWIGPTEAAKEAEAYWFTEGLARWVATDLLFRFGLIGPSELSDEMERLAAIAVTSPFAHDTNEALAARATAKDPGALPLLVARGALYAARIDALLRKRSSQKRPIGDLLKALLVRARTARGPLPTSAWTDAVSAELGPDEARAFAELVVRGAPFVLPDEALGPCFRPTPRRYRAFDPGYDDVATRASSSHEIVGLRQGGPAERAGLRAGDRIVSADFGGGRTDRQAEIVLERAGAKQTLRYLPAGPAAPGQGWARRPDVRDDACVGK